MTKQWYQKKNQAAKDAIRNKNKPKKQTQADKEKKQTKLDFTILTQEQTKQIQQTQTIKPAKNKQTGKYEWEEQNNK